MTPTITGTTFRPELLFWNERRGACLVDSVHPRLGRELSKRLGGSFFSGRGYLSWSYGSRAITILDRSSWVRVESARHIVETITGEVPGFTIGQLARALVEWIGPAVSTSSVAARRSLEECWRFYMCKPCKLEQASMYDLESCFYTLLSRVKTVRPVFTKKDLLWVDEATPGEESRFRRVVEAVAFHKELRNALVGAMIGGATGRFYSKGEPHDFKAKKGPRAELGAAVVRTAYELCQLQAKVAGAVYANTDSIIVEGCEEPLIWSAAQLPYRLLARGPGDVQAIGKYQVGTQGQPYFKRTAYYRDGDDFCVEQEPSRVVNPTYHAWVYQAA